MKTLNCACKASLALTTFAVLGFVTSQPTSAASFYSITDLGIGTASDINDSGQVVGNLGASAFLWSEGTGFIELGTFGGTSSYGVGINNLGQVIGSVSYANNDEIAFIWSESIGFTDLGTFSTPEIGFRQDSPVAINDSGQVLGSSLQSPFLWTERTGITNAPFYGSFPNDINNLGQVVGSTEGRGELSFFWSESTGTITFVPPGSYYSTARSINDLGQVAGGYFGDNRSNAYLWTLDTGVLDLGTLRDGDDLSYANDINNSGQIVGYSGIDALGVDSGAAFIWENGVMSDLNSLVVNGSGWKLTTAEAINEKGQIVGYGQFNGESHAFVLTPQTSPEPESIPEPSSALGVLAFGSFAANFLLKRRKAMRR